MNDSNNMNRNNMNSNNMNSNNDDNMNSNNMNNGNNMNNNNSNNTNNEKDNMNNSKNTNWNNANTNLNTNNANDNDDNEVDGDDDYRNRNRNDKRSNSETDQNHILTIASYNASVLTTDKMYWIINRMKQHHIAIVAIQETGIHANHERYDDLMKRLRRCIEMDDELSVGEFTPSPTNTEPKQGRGTGMTFIFNRTLIRISSTVMDRNSGRIHRAALRYKGSNQTINLINVYGYADAEERREKGEKFNKYLRQAIWEAGNRPCVIMGDFNSVLSNEDRSSGKMNDTDLTHGALDLVSSTELVDAFTFCKPSHIRPIHTYQSNIRSDVTSRIDLALLNRKAAAKLSRTAVIPNSDGGERNLSDHAMILIELKWSENTPRYQRTSQLIKDINERLQMFTRFPTLPNSTDDEKKRLNEEAKNIFQRQVDTYTNSNSSLEEKCAILMNVIQETSAVLNGTTMDAMKKKLNGTSLKPMNAETKRLLDKLRMLLKKEYECKAAIYSANASADQQHSIDCDPEHEQSNVENRQKLQQLRIQIRQLERSIRNRKTAQTKREFISTFPCPNANRFFNGREKAPLPKSVNLEGSKGEIITIIDGKKVKQMFMDHFKAKLSQADSNTNQSQQNSEDNDTNNSSSSSGNSSGSNSNEDGNRSDTNQLPQITLLKRQAQDRIQQWKEKYKRDPFELLVAEITLEDVTDALQAMKNNKAPGPSGITVEHLRCMPTWFLRYMAEQFNLWLQQETIPTQMRFGTIIPVIKNPKIGNVLSNFRPITLLEVMSKLFSSILTHRLLSLLDGQEKELLALDAQHGFVRGGSCFIPTSTVLDIAELIKIANLKKTKKSNEAGGAFLMIDIEAAYDSVKIQTTQTAMEMLGIPQKFIALILSMMQTAHRSVNTGVGISDTFDIKGSLPQGDSLSPIIFVLIMEMLARFIEQIPQTKFMTRPEVPTIPRVFIYADDVITPHNSTKDAQEVGREIEVFLLTLGLKLSRRKTVVVPIEEDPSKWVTTPFRISKCEKYLGSPFGDSEEAKSLALLALKQKVQRIQSNIIRTRDFFSMDQMIHIINPHIRGWMNFHGSTKKVARYSELREIDTRIRSTLKRATGYPNDMSNEFLYLPKEEGGFGLESFEHIQNKALISAALKILNSPKPVGMIKRALWEKSLLKLHVNKENSGTYTNRRDQASSAVNAASKEGLVISRETPSIAHIPRDPQATRNRQDLVIVTCTSNSWNIGEVNSAYFEGPDHFVTIDVWTTDPTAPNTVVEDSTTVITAPSRRTERLDASKVRKKDDGKRSFEYEMDVISRLQNKVWHENGKPKLPGTETTPPVMATTTTTATTTASRSVRLATASVTVPCQACNNIVKSKQKRFGCYTHSYRLKWLVKETRTKVTYGGSFLFTNEDELEKWNIQMGAKLLEIASQYQLSNPSINTVEIVTEKYLNQLLKENMGEEENTIPLWNEVEWVCKLKRTQLSFQTIEEDEFFNLVNEIREMTTPPWTCQHITDKRTYKLFDKSTDAEGEITSRLLEGETEVEIDRKYYRRLREALFRDNPSQSNVELMLRKYLESYHDIAELASTETGLANFVIKSSGITRKMMFLARANLLYTMERLSRTELRGNNQDLSDICVRCERGVKDDNQHLLLECPHTDLIAIRKAMNEKMDAEMRKNMKCGRIDANSTPSVIYSTQGHLATPCQIIMCGILSAADLYKYLSSKFPSAKPASNNPKKLAYKLSSIIASGIHDINKTSYDIINNKISLTKPSRVARTMPSTTPQPSASTSTPAPASTSTSTSASTSTSTSVSTSTSTSDQPDTSYPPSANHPQQPSASPTANDHHDPTTHPLLSTHIQPQQPTSNLNLDPQPQTSHGRKSGKFYR